ncbi:hypothetical protein D4T97_011730 [Siminovitchia acidinfaciens]|uniref:Uncharacterized protein n=1 Tax=Siminovitchia acidinfaciens TaxID=2321395 RepID=A0A429Y052_9BACI|nr:hypothetical protein D4T97_011730 [Siminovitchia acidinfaciens]
MGTIVIVTVIIFLLWPRMKQIPKKDKRAFFVPLPIGLVLSMFDLQHMKGPVTLIEDIFKPIGQFMAK